MRLNDDGKTVAAMDVLVPGVGELIGGSQREERLDVRAQPYCSSALLYSFTTVKRWQPIRGCSITACMCFVACLSIHLCLLDYSYVSSALYHAYVETVH